MRETLPLPRGVDRLFSEGPKKSLKEHVNTFKETLVITFAIGIICKVLFFTFACSHMLYLSQGSFRDAFLPPRYTNNMCIHSVLFRSHLWDFTHLLLLWVLLYNLYYTLYNYHVTYFSIPNQILEKEFPKNLFFNGKNIFLKRNHPSGADPVFNLYTFNH